MKAKIFRILGVAGFIVAISSLSACFAGPYYPAHPAYSYSSPVYPYPQYVPKPVYVHPEYVPKYVPPPRYAYNPHPYWQYRQRWEHEEHEEHVQHQKQVQHEHDHDWHKQDQDHH